MFSARFAREVIVTRHARQHMNERGISEAVLLRVIDEGQLRYRDSMHLWAWLNVAGRQDNLLCAVLVLEDALVVKTVLHHVREVSQDWNTHVSYAADGTVVETVILEAGRSGAWPLHTEHRETA